MTLERKVLALCALAACGGGGEPGGDAPVSGCTRPALDAPWLADLVTGDLAQLAGAPRATLSERGAARSYLAARLAAMGWAAQTQDFPGGTNVFATIPATMGGIDPEVIVGAHFDTVIDSPGADDNASGCVAVLAVARYLADLPCRTAPVTIVLFDQEEAGLFGSRAFAQTRAPATVRAVHTLDQVAWDADGDRRFELESPTPALEAEWRAAAQIVGVPVTATTTGGTDHQSFRDAGFAAIGLSEEYVEGDTSPYRHQPGDTAATVDVAYLALAAQLAGEVIMEEVSP